MKMYKVIQNEKVIGYMGIVENKILDVGSLTNCNDKSVGLVLDKNFKVIKNKFYNAILTYWFCGIDTNDLKEKIKNGYMGLVFRYVKDVELQYI